MAGFERLADGRGLNASSTVCILRSRGADLLVRAKYLIECAVQYVGSVPMASLDDLWLTIARGHAGCDFGVTSWTRGDEAELLHYADLGWTARRWRGCSSPIRIGARRGCHRSDTCGPPRACSR